MVALEQMANKGRDMAGLIDQPAEYVPLHALAFGALGTPGVVVDAGNPLPVRVAGTASPATPLAGVATGAAILGPFLPALSWPIWVSLSGAWTGQVQLLRSVDGGATKLPLTVAGQPWASYTAPANEIAVEETVAGASYYLSVALTGGTLTYRVAQ